MSQLQRPEASDGSGAREVNGEVTEVFISFGLAHVAGDDGRLYGINSTTRGLSVSDLRTGMRVRCTVEEKLGRVLFAELY